MLSVPTPKCDWLYWDAGAFLYSNKRNATRPTLTSTHTECSRVWRKRENLAHYLLTRFVSLFRHCRYCCCSSAAHYTLAGAQWGRIEQKKWKYMFVLRHHTDTTPKRWHSLVMLAPQPKNGSCGKFSDSLRIKGTYMYIHGDFTRRRDEYKKNTANEDKRQ